MNVLLIARYLGIFIGANVLFMLPSLLWSVYFREWDAAIAFLASMAVCAVAGPVLYGAGRFASNRMFQREGLGLVGIGWLAVTIIGAMPYYFGNVLPPVSALFESTSGFTTTGASVITDIEAVDKSILFWRAFTHWLGGMGIIVLFIAVLPYLGAGGKQLFRTESSGPDPRGLGPRIQDTASFLYKLYLGMTFIMTLLLMAAGMNFYDALCHTCSTLATGGFSTRNESVGAYDSVAIEAIMIFFMIVSATNFGLYFSARRTGLHALTRNTEFRWFLAILAIATLLITLNLSGWHRVLTDMPQDDKVSSLPFGEALRQAAFQVTSLQTGTGFATADFDAWPDFSRTMLFVLMFIGGCAGSTAGGIKVVRVIMLFKMALRRVESMFRPKMIRAIRIDGMVIDETIQKTVYAFFFLNIFLIVLGTFFMLSLGLPFVSAISAVVSCLFVVGPGFEFVGPLSSFANVPDPGKLLLSFYMVLGRLELFTILVMFIPSFWRHD